MAAEELGQYGSPERERENTHICVETRAEREENVARWNYPSTLSQIQLQVPAPSLSEERHLVVETKPRPPTTLCVPPSDVSAGRGAHNEAMYAHRIEPPAKAIIGATCAHAAAHRRRQLLSEGSE